MGVHLPHCFNPRSYQDEFLNAMADGCKRAALVWHRRSGKDKTVLNFVVPYAWNVRKGTYYYFFPTYAQGKKILWDGIDASGFPFMDHFPPDLVQSKNETELQVTLKNGSIFQIVGTDKMDSIVGTNPVGCVFSEYSLQSPRAWDLVRPILRENGGWAVFIYTPRGKNHGHKLFTLAQGHPEWFTSLKTVADTRRDSKGENGGYVVSPADIQAERDSGMSEELLQQEFYCSFEGAMEGSYYGDQVAAIRNEGRFRPLPWIPELGVTTAWDLGVGDQNAIGFTQSVKGWLHWIDFLEGEGAGLEYYIKQLRERPYVYDRHFGPHDLTVRDYSTGQTRLQAAAKLGLHFTLVPKLTVLDGINALRRVLPRSIFDEVKCGPLIDRLAAYRREWDDKNLVFKPNPVHDWSSHGADMARYRAVMYTGDESAPRQTHAITDFDPRYPAHAETEFLV